MARFSGEAIETKAARRDRAQARASYERRHRQELTERDKVAILGQAIATAIARRGAVAMEDCRQAGLSEGDCKRLYDEALAYARRLDPAINASDEVAA